MRVRDQTLILVLVASLASGGCARLLGTILAPQEAAMATAGRVADVASAPVQPELGSVGSEVDRLLAGRAGNVEELERIKAELEGRMTSRTRQGSAQSDPERLRPWHPRVPDAQPSRLPGRPIDTLVLGYRSGERGLPASCTLPDGVPQAAPPPMVDVRKIR